MEAGEDDFGWAVPKKGKKNKKGGKAAVAPAAAVAAVDTLKEGQDKGAEKFDAFETIKLDDTPMLDLSFDTSFSDKKTSGFGDISAWGSSSWATGTKTTTTSVETKEPEIDNNPWSLNRGKPKKKNTGFSFSALDDGEKVAEDPPPPPAEEKEEYGLILTKWFFLAQNFE